MTSMRDALHKALAAKRAQIIRDNGHIKPSVADHAASEGLIRVKYVRCTKCNNMEAWHAFNMNGAKPNFCKCKPGTEDLVTFELEIGKPKDESDDT